MAYEIEVVLVTSDLQGHIPTASFFKFSTVIVRTAVQQLTGFKLTACHVVPLQ